MIKTFTYDDVVRYLYSETSTEENEQIAKALTSNEELMSFYMDALEIRSQLNLIVRSPSKGFVASVMNYSALRPNLMQPVPTA